MKTIRNFLKLDPVEALLIVSIFVPTIICLVSIIIKDLKPIF